METSSQVKFRRFIRAEVNIIEPFSTQRITGMSVQPALSALILAATSSIAFSILALGM